ncbi:hypothetical protein MASR2M15_27580 [Anaerolineales bacterium]
MKKESVSLLGLIGFLLIMSLLILPVGSIQAIGEPTATPSTIPEISPSPTPILDDESLLDQILDKILDGDLDSAMMDLNSLLERDPLNADAYVLRASIYARQSDLEKAIDEITKAIELVPYSWDYYTYRGDLYAHQNEIGQAVLDYNQAIFLNPRYAPAYDSRSVMQAATGKKTEATIDSMISLALVSQPEEAMKIYTDAIQLGESEGTPPETALAYYNRGLILLNQDDFQESINDFSAGINIQIDMHDNYLARGIAFRNVGDLESAGADFITRMTLLEREGIEKKAAIGDTLALEMSYGTVYYIEFEGKAGDILQITARDRDLVKVDPLIALSDENGVSLGGDDDYGGGYDALIEGVELSEDGVYTLMVSHANGGYKGAILVSIEKQ